MQGYRLDGGPMGLGLPPVSQRYGAAPMAPQAAPSYGGGPGVPAPALLVVWLVFLRT